MLLKPPKGKYQLFKGCSCIGCNLDNKDQPWLGGAGFSLPSGKCTNGVALVAEGLGKDEVVQGKPLVGRSGYLTNRIISLLKGLHGVKATREAFGIWNTVACQPPKNRKPTPEEVQHCDQYFQRVMGQWKPKVIMPLGDTALYKLTGQRGILDYPKYRKPKRGYVYKSTIQTSAGAHTCHVVPTIHPAFLLRAGNRRFITTVVQDIHKALTIAEFGHTPYEPQYTLYPTQMDLLAFYERCKSAAARGDWLSADIETPYSSDQSEEEYINLEDQDILRISFSFRAGEAITVPFTPTFIPIIKKILALTWEFVIFWNYLFDLPRLLAHGCTITSKILDGMWLYHWYQSDTPKSLGYVGSVLTPLPEWKSEAEASPEYYSCCDADAPMHAVENMHVQLKKHGRWDTFVSDWVNTEPILHHMGRGAHSGLKVDIAQRDLVEKKYRDLSDGIRERIQELIPDGAKPVTERKVLKEAVDCPRCYGKKLNPDLKKIRKEDGTTLKGLKEFFAKHGKKREWFIEEPCPKCDGGKKDVNVLVKPKPGVEMQGFLGTADKWRRIDDFNPGSDQQVKLYCHFKREEALSQGLKSVAKGYKVPTYKGAETTDETALKRLYKNTNDKVFQMVLEDTKYSTINSRYIPRFLWEVTNKKKQKFIIDQDGFVRSDFTAQPSSWRMASMRPNIQNIPKRPNEFITKEMIREFRRMFIARKGWEIGQADWKSAEAVITGHYANDEEFIAIAQLGIHAFLATEVLAHKGERERGLKVGLDSLQEIKETISWIKKHHPILYDQCKVVVYLSLYGGTPKKILMDNPEHFTTEAEAAWIQELLFTGYARKIREWQERTLKQADGPGHFLQNVFGYRHYFWNVYRWDHKKQKKVWGSDAKRILSFLPQSTVTGILRQSLRNFNSDYPELVDYLRWPIHDQLLTEYPIAEREVVLGALGEVMQRPVPELDGLQLGVETEVGPTWGDVKEIELPIAA